MELQVSINETLIHGRTLPQLQKAVEEGLVIRDYLNAELSLGEVAEILRMSYEEARNWLHQKGIPTLRKMDVKLERIEEENSQAFLNELDLSKGK